MQKCEYKKWGMLELWSLYQTACVLSGVEPNENTKLLKESTSRVLDLMGAAISSGKLRTIMMSGKGMYFNSGEIVEWAKTEQINVPIELEKLVRKFPVRHSSPNNPRMPKSQNQVSKFHAQRLISEIQKQYRIISDLNTSLMGKADIIQFCKPLMDSETLQSAKPVVEVSDVIKEKETRDVALGIQQTQISQPTDSIYFKDEHKLDELLNAVKRAAEGQGETLDLQNMPGIRKDLYDLARAINKDKYGCALPTFCDWLKKKKVKFKRGARSSSFYKELFPHHKYE